jgi:hypothetical protein
MRDLLQDAHNMMTKENKNEKRRAEISADGAIDAMAFQEVLGTCFTT